MSMKSFQDFILERIDYSVTGVDREIIELASYIYDDLVKNKLKKASYDIQELRPKFPILKTWEYNSINVYINPKYTNKTAYLKYSNSIGIFMKSYNRSILNHELTHVKQSTVDTGILLVDYDSQAVLTQIKSFFRKNAHNIELLKTLLYVSDEREIEAFTQSFRKCSKKEKIEILSYILLLKYFNLKNLISDVRSLRQFVTIWYQYYNTSIPFFDRVSIRRSIGNNTLEVNKKEVNQFIDTINSKLNKIGTTYMRKINNQYLDSEFDVEKFVKLLNEAKLNISRNSVENVMDFTNIRKYNISPTLKYDITADWEE